MPHTHARACTRLLRCLPRSPDGCSEASVPTAIEAMTKQSITPVVDNTIFVLLGATAELGPARTLLELGCSVACISRKGKKLAALLSDTESHAGTTNSEIRF